MKNRPFPPVPLSACCLLAALEAGAAPAPAPNGIEMPVGYQNWRLIAVSQRTENQTLRAILGNSVAIDAARAGKTNPWPNGAILAKLSWKQKTSETFPTAVVPGEFVLADFMVKDDARFAATGGWGFARWLGLERKPYGDANLAQECLACHGSMKGKDYVFTVPVKLP
jgi:hypothetical protein